MNLVIVQGRGPSLFGCDWLKLIKLNWAHFHKLETIEVGLGTIKEVQAKLYLKKNATPKFADLVK